ncbi:MAG: DUF1553 domain-containing protein [Pseudomonadales bacterium]|jgi:hypothetical protein|nr:DUF1553 domain-containing protein [Pseudomonadales bacterium]
MPKIITSKFVAVLMLIAAVSACSRSEESAQTTVAPATAALPVRIDYNWHVRPILSDNCFNCHGPDEKGRKAGLRLDVAAQAYAELPESPGKFAIVPGEIGGSELIRRINAADPDVRMPPESSHKQLSSRQIAILEQWVEEGAEYKPHWAFITPERPAAPEVSGAVRNDIDRFVLTTLAEQGLQGSPEADKETLINRVSLTLTGLPPTLAEVDAFLTDDSPEAYEHLVDRLLNSSAYAEHMSNYWLDLARWSESDGFLFDHHDRLLWPWRDWVIDAFSQNMPFDEFITKQLAGDLLPNPSREDLLATTYVRLGKRTSENGVIEPEYKAEYMIERTDNALGVSLMGLTLGCARCHDHKYDPISQVDYYSLGAFFNSADEPGFYPPGHSAIQAGPTLPWPSAGQEQRITVLERDLANAEQNYQQALARAAITLSQNAAPQELWAQVEAALQEGLDAYYPFDTVRPVTVEELPELPVRAVPPIELVEQPAYGRRGNAGQAQQTAAPQPPRSRIPAKYVLEQMSFSDAVGTDVLPAIIQEPILREGHIGNAFFVNETNKGFFDHDVGWYDRGHPFSFDLWFYAAQEYPDVVPVFNYRDDDNSGGAGYRVQLEDGTLWFYIAHSRPANMIALRMENKFPLGEWVHLTLTYDGSSTAAGTKIYINGTETAVHVDHDSLSRSILPMGYAAALDQHYGLAFGMQFREKSPVGSGLDEFRVYGKSLSALEVAYLHDAASLQGETPDASQVRDFLLANDLSVKNAFAALTDAREAHNAEVTLVPQVLVMGDSPAPQASFVLNRGVYDQHGQAVSPRGMDHILPWDESLPANRLGLARWLMDPQHPLTARVFVNRLWQNHFGVGLVKSANDFGAQGDIPSHPDLLDWLAREFIESGWDIKHLNRLIVTSATYRQNSAQSAALAERDPGNTWLARGPRWRMTAEMIRDSALRQAGLLVDQVGGPSVHPYQPDDIWNSSNSSYSYPATDEVSADEHHRRSMYTFIKRTALHPYLQIFDFPDRSVSAASRRQSNTPLQALALMNDPQFLEAARVLATQVMEDNAIEDERAALARLYRLLARRIPTEEQLQLLDEYYRSQLQAYAEQPEKVMDLLSIGVTPLPEADASPRLAALANVATLIMNSPDAFTVW